MTEQAGCPGGWKGTASGSGAKQHWFIRDDGYYRSLCSNMGYVPPLIQDCPTRDKCKLCLRKLGASEYLESPSHLEVPA